MENKSRPLTLGLYAAFWAPLLLVFALNSEPWFKSNSRVFANRVNATLISAVLFGLILLNAWLTAIGKDGSALPESYIVPVIIFAAIWLLLWLHFTESRLIQKSKQVRGMSRYPKVLCLCVGCLAYALAIADFLSKRPV